MIEVEIAREITETLRIPTIGIGAGPHCDSQVLVLYDVLGMYPNPPESVKQYADIGSVATNALRSLRTTSENAVSLKTTFVMVSSERCALALRLREG